MQLKLPNQNLGGCWQWQTTHLVFDHGIEPLPQQAGPLLSRRLLPGRESLMSRNDGGFGVALVHVGHFGDDRPVQRVLHLEGGPVRGPDPFSVDEGLVTEDDRHAADVGKPQEPDLGRNWDDHCSAESGIEKNLGWRQISAQIQKLDLVFEPDPICLGTFKSNRDYIDLIS